MIEQAVILCGGLGTRLGQLTAATPKPLLPVGGVPFLQILIQEIARSGVRNFLLLAGHHADQVVAFADTVADKLNLTINVEVAIEARPAGTGGALYEAGSRLAESFLLLNGDSLLDLPLWQLDQLLAAQADAIGAIALREVADCGRYGKVELAGSRITSFAEKQTGAGAGMINGGVYLFRRSVLDYLQADCSLERDVLPVLAAQRRLFGRETRGFFIDIGLPETFNEAQNALVAHRQQPAVFFDRDGVLNLDHGHVGTAERFTWSKGAVEALRLVNELGYYAFVVTNQAGIAKGKYTVEDYWTLRDRIRAELAEAGAQIDDERFCPYHPEASVPEFRAQSPDRKPAPGMLLDLMARWPVERQGSFLIGDQETDLEAAAAAGLPAFRFAGGDLSAFVQSCIEQGRAGHDRHG